MNGFMKNKESNNLESPSIKKNYIFNLFSQFLTFSIPLITNPYISRIFGANKIGVFSYTTANVTYFILFGMLGISGYGQREVAICRDNKEKTSKIFCELQIIHLITFFITSVGFVIMAFHSKNYMMYYLVQLISIIASFLDINWFYQAYERFEIIAIRNCIIKLLQMVATFIFIHTKNDLMIYIVINCMGTLLSNISLWIKIHKYIDFIPINNLNLKRHIKDILIFFIPTIAASVYSILDKSIINWITHDTAENGYYEQANKILTIANIFVQSLSNVSAPRMSNLFYRHNNDFKLKFNRALQFMLLISIPTAFGVSAIAERFVPFFFGDGFEKVISILYIFMPMVIVLGFSVYLDGMYLVPSGRRAESAKAVCIGSAINLVLNIILVYFWKSIGAAIATLITECIVSVLMIWMSKKMIDWHMIFSMGSKYIILSLIMFLCVHSCGYFIKNDFLCIIIQITIGVMLYGGALLLIKDQLIYELLNYINCKIKRIK